jgi:radical SAM-linked protein
MKYLITFEKGESVRWLGHLDILRTFERAIRRADLPISFTTGFNPREKLAFASALSVGITASAEPATIELTDSVTPDSLITRLNEKLPSGIQLQSAVEIPDAGSRDLLNSFDRAEFHVTCVTPADISVETIGTAVYNLLARESLIAEREREGKVKRIEIRPFIYSIEAGEMENGRIAFTMVLGIGMEGVAKPQEIVSALANEVPGLAVRRIHRSRLISKPDHTIVSMNS